MLEDNNIDIDRNKIMKRKKYKNYRILTEEVHN